MYSGVWFSFCLLFICDSILSPVCAEELTEYRITLDPDDRFNVTWSFTGHLPEDEITFTLDVETTGWVGLGFSPQGSMVGADIFIAWVDANGNAYFQDMYGETNGLPVRDESEDVKLISATESDGKTRVVFSRKLNTCDEKDNVLKTDTTRLIYAYSFKDPSNNVLTSANYHGTSRRGSKSVYLFDPKPPKHTVPDDALTADLINSQYAVPSDDTTYYCSFHPAPEVDRKHHLIGLEPIITPGNEGIVHHAVLYGCWNVTLEHLRGTNKTEGICYGAEMPEFENSCRTVIYAWAVGGGDFYFPEGTGYPLGTGDLDSPEFFMLEMHYDNPAMKPGMVDSSGLRLVYTPILRDLDVGMLEAGTVFGIMVPPSAKEFEITSYCHSSCTEQWIPEEGITVFSYFLHAHLLGVKIKVEVYRDDQPLEILAIDNNYDFNYQENRLYSEPKKLYPGDTLKVTCTLDSRDRTDVTYGGFSSREEMCVAFLGYYPKRPIAGCDSLPTFFADGTHPLFGTLDVDAQIYPGSPYVDVQSSLANISWSDEYIAKAQEVVLQTQHINQCRTPAGFDREDVDTFFSVNSYPTIPEPTDTSCSAEDTLEDDNSAAEDTLEDDNSAAAISSFSITLTCISTLITSLLASQLF